MVSGDSADTYSKHQQPEGQQDNLDRLLARPISNRMLYVSDTNRTSLLHKAAQTSSYLYGLDKVLPR